MPASASMVALVDHARLRHLSHPTPPGHPDDGWADLREQIELLDPRTRAFGTDVATLVHDCLDYGLLSYQAPVTAITIEPTTAGAARDGGFRILADIAGTITLASPRIDPGRFGGPGDRTAIRVLDTVAATVDRLNAAYRTAAGR